MTLAVLGIAMLLFTLWTAAQMSAEGYSYETKLVEGFFLFKSPFALCFIALGGIGFLALLWKTLQVKSQLDQTS